MTKASGVFLGAFLVCKWLYSLLKTWKPRTPRRLKPPRKHKFKGVATAQLKLRPFKTGAPSSFSANCLGATLIGLGGVAIDIFQIGALQYPAGSLFLLMVSRIFTASR